MGSNFNYDANLDAALPKLPNRGRKATRSKVVKTDSSLEGRFQEQLDEIRSAPRRDRHTTLDRASYKVGELVWEGLPEDTARLKLCEAGRAVGLTVGEVDDTVISGLTTGMAHEPEVHRLNYRHAVVSEGGKTVVLTERFHPVLKRRIITTSSRRDFENLYANQFVTVEDEKIVPLGKYWFTSPYRRQYDGLIFAPGEHIRGYYNLWRGLREQKRHSFSPTEAWWFEVLKRGRLVPEHVDWAERVKCDELHENYQVAMNVRGKRRRAWETKLGRNLRSLLPGDYPGKIMPRTGNSRKYCWIFPPLSICREYFDEITKSKWDWPSAEDEQTSGVDDDDIFLGVDNE